MDFPLKQQGVNEIYWKSDTYGNQVLNRSIHYEISAVFYNYAALNLNYALTMFFSKFNYDKDLIIRLLRISLWSLIRSTDYGNKCAKYGELPVELSQSCLQMLYDLVMVVALELKHQQIKSNPMQSNPQILSEIQMKIFKCTS